MGKVVDRVVARCRDAMLGGVPIVYVKTDSRVVARSIATAENPLVVPICGDSYGMLKSAMRPLDECGGGRIESAGNIKEELPKTDKVKYPHLWLYKMPENKGGQEFKQIFEALEAYVVEHEDENSPCYKILQSSIVILYSSSVELSPMLKNYVEIIDVDYPKQDEIEEIIAVETGDKESRFKALAPEMLGFSIDEAVLTVRKITAVCNVDDAEKAKEIIKQRKKQKMEGGALELCIPSGEIGGMDNFREWLSRQIKPVTEARDYKTRVGTNPPKGVLLCGIPGCGKSEAAKFTAQELNLPLLKMDVGSLMDKFQGESERKMRDALKLAEAMAPCVLWIDELEKGFEGAGGSGDSTGSFKRMFGYMLGWMQENQEPCFIFATANNISGLPKEFFRSGRFDALYAVYLPTAEECARIFKACVYKCQKNYCKNSQNKGMRPEEALFEYECLREGFYRKFVNENLAKGDRTRIVIGSDIQKIVSVALRSLKDTLKNNERINEVRWENALRKALDESVYGDSEENLESIAISYCRMLRKRFTPTAKADKVIFKAEDYRTENYAQYKNLKAALSGRLSDEEYEQCVAQLKKCEILKTGEREFEDAYDKGIYESLRDRINRLAFLVEEYEQEILIKR